MVYFYSIALDRCVKAVRPKSSPGMNHRLAPGLAKLPAPLLSLDLRTPDPHSKE